MKSRWKLKFCSVKLRKLQSAKSWNQSPPSVLSGWKSHRIWWVKRNFQTRIFHLSVIAHFLSLIHPENHRRHSSHPPSYLIGWTVKENKCVKFSCSFSSVRKTLLLHDDLVGSPQVHCRRLKPVEPDHWHKECANKECNFSRSWDYVCARAAPTIFPGCQRCAENLNVKQYGKVSWERMRKWKKVREWLNSLARSKSLTRECREENARKFLWENFRFVCSKIFSSFGIRG